MEKKLPKLLGLIVLASIMLVIDFFLFAFTKCLSCTSFSQFLSSSHSLFTPVWASLVVLLSGMKKN